MTNARIIDRLVVINAPSNLGLRPLRPGHEPGTWAAPAVLAQAGLFEAVNAARHVDLTRPTYSPEAQIGTPLRNGPAMRQFNLNLAEEVETVLAEGAFPLVIGGDCSILLGALAGARRQGPLSLVHVDGHSDFRHPGNYDAAASLGAVAGMDLALATGRGEALMTEWPGVHAPLIPDTQAVQIGERELFDDDFAWPDIADTAITRLDVFTARRVGMASVLERTLAVLDRQPDWLFWLHFDVDVLDQSVMPAVDSPGTPGIDPEDLVILLRKLVSERRCIGMTTTVYDPDVDSDRRCATLIVSILAKVLSGSVAAANGRFGETRDPEAIPRSLGHRSQDRSGMLDRG